MLREGIRVLSQALKESEVAGSSARTAASIAAVHLALTLVHWFETEAIRKR